MHSYVFNKPFPSAFGPVFKVLLAGISTMLLGVFCMTTKLFYQVTTRGKKILPFALASLVVFSVIAISNVFVPNQANAQYLSFKWKHRTNTPICPEPHNDARERCQHEDILIIKGSEASYPTLEGVLRRRTNEKSAWEAQLRWRIDEGAWESSEITRAPGNNASVQIDSPYGHWVLKEKHSTATVTNQDWVPNTNGIKSIPPGSTAEIELLSWLDINNRQAAAVHNKLTIRHNTSATWDSSIRNTTTNEIITGVLGSSSIDNAKDAIISTHENGFTNFNFKSNLFDGASAVDSQPLEQLQPAVTVGAKTYQWGYTTSYGQWLVGNETTCNGIKCYDVRFEPDMNEIDNISGKNVKLELEINLTENSMITETDKLVYLLNIPTISISAVNPMIIEGNDAQIKIKSDINPGSGSYAVKYIPKNIVGNFLDESDGPNSESRMSGESRTVNFNFQTITLQPSGTEYSHTFDLDMRAIDMINSATGTVSVELDRITSTTNDITYAVDPTNNTATIMIEDQNTPQVTISNAPNIVASQDAEFPIVATPHPHGNELTVRIIPTEIGSNFLAPDNGKMSGDERTPTITFQKQGDGTGTGTIPIQTMIDNSSTIGVLKVQLLADSNTSDPSYTITGSTNENTKIVAISSYPIRTISIEEDTININEGDSTTVTLTADGDPERDDLTVNYTPEGGNDFLLAENGKASNDMRSDVLDFEENPVTGKWEAEITIRTKPIDTAYRGNGEGEITVKLKDSSSGEYMINSNANHASNKITIKVKDSTKPLVTIRNGNELPSGEFRDNDKVKRPNFPMRSNHAGSVTIKYEISETGDFLDPVPTANEVRSADIAFNSSKDGSLIITAVADRNISNRSAITVTLLEDPDNYVLSDNLAERSGTVIVNDPSYVDVHDGGGNFNVGGTNFNHNITPDFPNRSRVGFLYIKDTPVNYEATSTARIVGREKNNIKISAEWYLNNYQSTSDKQIGVTPDSDIKQTNQNNLTVTTPYGDFRLEGNWTSGHHVNRPSKFIFNRAKLNAIPLGSRARVVANIEAPFGVFGKNIVHLVPNTQAYWNSSTDTKTNTITQTANSYEVGTRKEGTIITHDTPSSLVFKSKLYNNSTTAVEATLMDEEAVADWSGMEKTHSTDYGKWIVGNLQNCGTLPQHMTQSKCYDVRFEPDLTAINQINGKIVKLDLETSITDETDTISFIITDEGISFDLDDGDSNIIKTTGSSPTIDDIDGTVTATIQSGDTFEIEVKETTNNAGEKTPPGMKTATVDASFTDFDSKVHGTDLTLGKWYFKESNASTTTIPGHTETNIVTRNFRFVPDDAQIGMLAAGDVRYSTITVNVMRSTEVISTETYTVAIYRSTLPVFTISTDTSSLNEGGTAIFKVKADADPGATPISIKYIPTNTRGDFLKIADRDDEKTEMLTSFTETMSGSEWTSNTFNLVLRADNSKDETDGIISVKLMAPNSSISSAKYITDPSDVAIVEVKDLTVPVITFVDATAVNQGTAAQFTLTATPPTWQDLAIRYRPTNSSGSFLDLTAGASGETRIADPIVDFPTGNSFPDSATMSTGTLTIPTIVDKTNATGMISVELLTDLSTSSQSYKISTTEADNTKTVTVNRTSPSVMVTIEESTIDIDEGETATIKFIADGDPMRDEVVVSYTPTETSTDTTYLKADGTDGSGDTRMAMLDFVYNTTTSKWEAEVEIETIANTMDQINGIISVQLDTPGAQAGYTIGTDPNDRVTINVEDLTVPTITIADATEITPGTTAQFILTADVEPRTGLTIHYTPTETGSNFLAASSGTSGTPTMTATPITFSGSPLVAMLPINTMTNSPNKSGEIKIKLLADTDNTSDPSYKITGDDASNTKLVRVSIDPIRTISIEQTSVDINEGGMTTITLIANDDPVRDDLMIKYTPTETSFMTSYLKDDGTDGSGDTRTATLDFELDTNTMKWEADIEIETVTDDETDGRDGIIEVVLDEPNAQDGYIIASDPNDRIIINVKDQTVPTISIEAAARISPAGIARFRLTTTKEPLRPLGIRYTPSETTTMFLNTSAGASGTTRVASPKIKFSAVSGNPNLWEGTLSVPTIDDPSNTSGTISVQLEADSNTADPSYMIAGSAQQNTKTVQIRTTTGGNPIVELTLEQVPIKVTEGGTATIKVIVNEDPVVSDLSISVTPTETSTGTTYLKTRNGKTTGQPRTESLVNFVPEGNFGKYSSTFTIDTNTDTVDAAHGVITVVLGSGTGYTVGTDNSVTINVIDNIKPEIKITEAPNVTGYDEDDEYDAEITLSSNIIPYINTANSGVLTIKYQREETGTNFLDPAATPNEERTANVTFSGSSPNITGTFDIPLQDDPAAGSGTITVTLLADADNYTLITAQADDTARSITVNDPSHLYFEFDDTTITSPKNTFLTIGTDKKSATLYIKDTTTTYTNFVGVLYALGRDHTDNKLMFQAKSFLDNTMTNETNIETGINKMLTTDYGIWHIDDQFPSSLVANSNESYFDPDDSAINSISPGSKARVELHFEVENDVTDVTTLHMLHYTTSLWDSNSGTSISKTKDSSDIATMLEATIKTYHDTESELSFNSILNDGSPVQLTAPVSTTVWNDEVTVDATYGTWFVGDKTTCDTDATCYKVQFRPNTTSIAGITGQTAKIELETKITENGQTTETDKITFQIAPSAPTRMISIKGTSIDLAEGGTAMITLEANDDPVNRLGIKYTPTETTESGTTYLEVVNSKGSGDSRTSDPLKFNQDPVSGKWEAILEIETTSDNADGPHGIITVVLDTPQSGDGYSIGSDPDDRITIKVIDAIKPALTFENAPEAGSIENHTFTDSSGNSQTIRAFLAKFPVTATASVTSVRPITVKYTATETSTNFLDDNKYTGRDYRPVQNNETYNVGETRTGVINFTNNSGTLEGTLEIPLVDPHNENSGTISITLQEDADNYTLPTQTADRTRTVAVKDPSYLEITFKDNTEISIDSDRKNATLYIKDTSATYAEYHNNVKVLRRDTNNGRYQVKWYLDNAFVNQSNKVGKGATLTSDYGDWRVHQYFGTAVNNNQNRDNSENFRRTNNTNETRFIPTASAINAIPAGSKVRVEMHTEAPHEVQDITTLNILHYTTSLWDSNSSTSLSRAQDNSAINNTIDATIKTYHGTQSDLSFNSILDDGSPTLLTAPGTTTHWSDEVTANTTYGDWFVGNQSTCDTNATCYSVKFVPNSTAINGITSETPKIELETKITESGQTTETDKLTFNITEATGYPEVVLTIEESSINVNAGEEATIKVTVSQDPVRMELPIKFTPTETSSNTSYLEPDENNKTSGQSRDFDLENFVEDTDNPGKYLANITIDTRNPNSTAIASGVITVTLDDPQSGAGYTVGTNKSITVNVIDIKPLIKIGTAEVKSAVSEKIGASGWEFRIDIPLTSDYPGDITVKFMLEESSTNFLKTPLPTQHEVTFSGASAPYTGAINLLLDDDDGEASGTFSITLQEDANKYTLSTTTNEKTKTFTVNDPSYIHVNDYRLVNNAPGDLIKDPEDAFEKDNDANVAELYVTNPSVAHSVETTARALRVGSIDDTNNFTVSASLYLNDSTVAENTPVSQTGSSGTVPTDYGDWVLDNSWSSSSGQPFYITESRFQISSTNLDNIPLDSKARIELNLSVPDGVTNKSTLHIFHNTASYWNSDKLATLVELRSKADIGDDKVGTIKTYQTLSPTSVISFKSKLYDGSANATEATLTETSGEWAHMTSYGEWVVNNQRACPNDSDAMCFDVTFEPSNNGDELKAISGKTVKLDLETIITSNSNEIEKDILTYQVIDYSTTFALATSGSNEITVDSGTTTYGDVTGTATIFKGTAHDLIFEIKETTDNQGTDTTNPSTNSTNGSSDTNFPSKKYDEDLSLGSWYVENEAGLTSVADPADSNFHTIMPRFLFRPKSTALLDLEMNSIRKSTLTIKIVDDQNTIITKEITVTITRGTPVVQNTTTVIWNTNSNASLTENRNTADFTANKEATITTTNSDLNELSFKSKLYEGQTSSTDTDLTAGTDIPGGWPGAGWSASTTYGRWIIGNLQDCETSAKCYSVRFVPDATEINKVKDKVLQFELETAITKSGQSSPAEIDTLTYIIEGRGVNFTLDQNNSSTIEAPATEIILADVEGSANIFYKAGDIFRITAAETTTNSATPETLGTVTTTSNSDAGFASNQYVTDLTLGSWYFAENNTAAPVADGIDSDHLLVARKVLFKPKTDAIANLPAGATRTSTITVSVGDGTTMSSNTFSVTINRVNTPALSISSPVETVVEGGMLAFIVTADANPGSTPIDIKFTANQVSGDYLNTDNTASDFITPGMTTTKPLTFSGTNTWTANLSIPLRAADSDNDTSDTITVVLDQPAMDAGYFVAKNPGNEATATVFDSDVTALSIADAPDTFNGEAAVFVITSTKAVADADKFPIIIRPSNVGNGDFLDETDGPNNADWSSEMDRTIADVTFSGAAPNFTYNLSVATLVSNTLTGGSITVEIRDDTSGSNNYYVNPNKRTASVTLFGKPTLSIAPKNATVSEGEELKFVITSDYRPRNAQNSLDVKYDVTQTGGFINSTLDISQTITATGLVFMEVGGDSTDWMAEIDIPLRVKDNLPNPEGSITVTLADDTSYIVAGSPRNTATATIVEGSNPIISIADAALTYNGDMAEFTLTSHIASADTHIIMVKPTEISGNFLNIDAGGSGVARPIADVTFGNTAPYTATIQIPTKIDSNSAEGIIEVVLEANTTNDTYNVHTDADESKARVTVYRTATLSIAPPNSEAQVNEGESLEFIVTADRNPRIPIIINHTITEESSSFLDPSVTKGTAIPTAELTFTQVSPYTVRIPIMLRDKDETVSDTGSIKVTLNDSANYQVAAPTDNEATVSIIDTTIPVISISDAPEIIAGENAMFTLISNTAISENQAFTVKIKPSSNFLNIDGASSGSVLDLEDVTFVSSANSFTYTFPIPTKVVDDEDVTSGIMLVELVENPTPTKYTISPAEGANSATVKILNGDNAPTLRIYRIDENNVETTAPVPEGLDTDTTLNFQVALAKPLAFDISGNYSVSNYEGEDAISATLGTKDEGADYSFQSGNFVIPAGDLTPAQQSISTTIFGDDLYEPDEKFNVNISIEGNSRLEVNSPIVITIMNDEIQERPFVYVSTDQESVTEGGAVEFKVNVVRPTQEFSPDVNPIFLDAPVTVELEVDEGEGSFIAWRYPRQITIPREHESVDISISTADDSIDEPNGAIKLSIVRNDNQYSIDEASVFATVDVMDNDDQTIDESQLPRISVAETAVNTILARLPDLLAGIPRNQQAAVPTRPTISVVALTTAITEGENAEFNLIASNTLTSNLRVSFMMNQNGDFLATENPTQVQINRLTNQARAIITTQDDQTAEGDGSITLQLRPDSTYKISSQNSATVAVSDAIDRQARKDEIASRTSEILPEMLNLVGSNALATTSQRIQQASNGASASYRINGAQDLRQIITTSGEMLNSEPESLRSILGNSAFAFDVYSENYLTNPVSVWGLGELKAVNSAGGTGALGWQGDAFSGHFGFDTKLAPNTLMGLTTSVVDMDAGYALKQNNEFIFQSRNTTFNPYLNWTSQNNDAQIQTIVGYGLGSIDIKQPNYQYETLQSYSSAISVNGNKRLYTSDSILTGGTSTLSLVGESWIARLDVKEKPDIFDAVSLSAQHHRVAIDGSHNISFTNGNSIKPTLSLGLLHDGKNQDALQGVELRNGVTYSNPIGLAIAGNARMIFEPTSQSRLWNLNGSLDFDYGHDQLGTMLTVSGTYAHGQKNYTDLLNMSILNSVGANSMDNSINTELQYGLALCNQTCLITPYAGYNFDANGANNSRLGTRFSVGSLLNLDYEYTNNPSSETTTNQKVQLNSRISW